MRPNPLVACFALILVAGACNSTPEPADAPQLLPRERFDWMGEPISFSIPPAGWRREGDTSGVKGIRFVKERSVGEGIGVGDYYVLADRNRSPYLREILANFDSYDEGGFAWDKALRKTYAYTDTPFNALETEIATTVNNEVGQAAAAWRNHDRDAARAHLQTALAEAQRLRVSLADVIDRVEFKPERHDDPAKYKLTGRRETTIAGEPAVIVDYTVTVPERQRTYAAREAYFVHNSHMFICTFIGLEDTLAVFDAMVASIEFPK